MPRLAVEAKEARREHILRAALRCFARSGYYPTTVDDIAAEAGVSKGAPYVYFESKEALFQQLYDSWDCGLATRIDAALARLRSQGSRSPRTTLEAIIVAVGAHVTEETDLCRVLIEARTQAAYVDAIAKRFRSSQADAEGKMKQLIEAGVARGEWPPETNPELHAQLILATLHGLMAQWHLSPGSFSWDEMARALAAGVGETGGSG
ncbi:MAG TPA: TetR/AcrR family transcriptional regulator [Candidatus Dormibacteraeota bacterium]|nr:TetR/AcrR family transcriptional regulator [Candidatus Dormibacteraeota bacterium]